MNKSKFLKRSLATLLAILMVVAMVPMSALAAEGDSSEPETPSSDLHVTVDTFPATYADGAYTVEVKDSRTVTVDWAEVEGTVLTLVTKAGTELQLPYTLDLKTTAEDMGNDVFKLTLKEKVGTAEAVSHDLIITVRNDVPEDDTSLREVVRVQNAKGSNGDSAISGKVEGSTITITVPYGYSETAVGLGADILDATKVFVPSSVHAKSEYKFVAGNKSYVVVTAGDGRSKRYNVNFVNEDVFSSFSVGGVDAVPGGTLTAPSLTVTVPKGYAGNNASGWVPKFETTENVVRVEGVPSYKWTNGYDPSNHRSWKPVDTNKQYARVLTADGTNTEAGDDAVAEILPIASERARWKWVTAAPGNVTLGAGEIYSITYLNIKTKANPDGTRVKVHVKEAPKYTESKLTELTLGNGTDYYVATANDIDHATKTINMVVDRDFWTSIGADTTNTTAKAIVSTGATIKPVAQGQTDDQSKATVSNTVNDKNQWTISNINAKSHTFRLRVTAENNTTSDYTVNVSQAGNYNTDITEFKLVSATGAEIVGVPNTENNIKLQLPYSLYNENAAPGVTGWVLQVKASDGAIIRSGNDATEKYEAHKLNGNFSDPYENGVTTFGKIFLGAFSSGNVNGNNNTNGSVAFSPRNLFLTVFNGESKEVYTISLVQADPDTKGSITGAKATTAYDNDLVYGWKEGEKLEDAHTGAINSENEFDVTVENHTLKLDMPYDAANNLYFEDITRDSGYAKVFRVLNAVGNNRDDTTAANCVRILPNDLKLDGTWQANQHMNDRGHDILVDNKQATDWFDLTTTAAEENIIYVVSEADWVKMGPTEQAKLEATAAGSNAAARATLEANCTNKYTISANYGTANTGDELTSFTDSGDVKVNYNTAYKTITVTVPGSYNWATYRDSDKYDFTLNFANSDNAVVIDKGQVTFANGDTDVQTATKKQKNEWNQWISGETTFFVKNGELFIYDKFTGKEIQVTEMGETFDNKAWGKIKGQQAQINVYNEDQTAPNYYRLELVVGVRSNKCELTSATVGETTVAVTGSETTVELPEGSDLTAQNLTLVTSPMSTVLVNGEAYRAGEPYNVEKPLTIVVTAEDGTKAEYTLTVTIGSDVPGPDEKPSDKYTDLDKVYSGHLERVKYAIDNGLMGNEGKEGIFNPTGTIKRQDFALIIARADLKAENPDATPAELNTLLEEKYAGAEDAFNDISKCNATQKAAIRYCSENGIINGNDKGGFNPTGIVSRVDAAVMLAGWCKLDVTDSENTNGINDWEGIYSAAKSRVNAVYKAGLMQGTGGGNFSPAQNLQRQQAAHIIVGALEFGNEPEVE